MVLMAVPYGTFVMVTALNCEATQKNLRKGNVQVNKTVSP
jgi:hypothetical protein